MEHVEDVWYFVFSGDYYYAHSGVDDYKFAARSLWQAVDYAAGLEEEWVDIVKFNGIEFVNVIQSFEIGVWRITHEHHADPLYARVFPTARKAYEAWLKQFKVGA